MLSYNSAGAQLQIYIDHNTNSGCWFRSTGDSGSHWTDWNKVALNYPDFYKEYGSITALSRGLGVLDYAAVIDMNNLGDGFKVYSTNASSQIVNGPSALDGGAVFVFSFFSAQIIRGMQIIFNGSHIYTRTNFGSWDTWVAIV